MSIRHCIHTVATGQNTQRKCLSENEGRNFMRKETKASGVPAARLLGSGHRKEMFSLQCGGTGPFHPVLEIMGSKQEGRGSGLVLQHQRTRELVLSSEQKMLTCSSVLHSPSS